LVGLTENNQDTFINGYFDVALQDRFGKNNYRRVPKNVPL